MKNLLLVVAGLCLLGVGCKEIGFLDDERRSAPAPVVPAATPLINEGSQIAPIDLGMTPFSHNGTAADGNGSWYIYTTDTGNQVVWLQNRSNGIGGLNVFTDGTFTTFLCGVDGNATTDPACSITCLSSSGCPGGIRIRSGAGPMSYTILTLKQYR